MKGLKRTGVIRRREEAGVVEGTGKGGVRQGTHARRQHSAFLLHPVFILLSTDTYTPCTHPHTFPSSLRRTRQTLPKEPCPITSRTSYSSLAAGMVPVGGGGEGAVGE